MSDYKTPKDKLITNEQALALNTCYKNKQIKVFGAADDSSFCGSSWYSLEDLEGYINYVKEQAEKQEINVNGIRFYFGVYPEGDSKEGQNTLFMCPTKASTTLSGSRRSRGEEIGDDDNNGGSDDVTTISAMNYGNGGNPPVNTYGE